MNWHILKIWPEFFDALLCGNKKCETRINDRNYQLGDVLVLREYIKEEDRYTGRVVIYSVTHITYTKTLPLPRDKVNMPLDWAVMSVTVWNKNLAALPF